MKQFLTKRLGQEKGMEMYLKFRQKYDELLSQADEKTGQQKKVFQKTLLPRIALYKTLQENGFSQKEAEEILYDHMLEIGARPMRKKYEMMDKLPFAYSFFRFGFTHIVPNSNLWEADINKSKKDEFKVTMHRCFWNDTFKKYGCPEICSQACRCDDITYSDLKHIEYERTQTLGTGGDCCDFHFIKKK